MFDICLVPSSGADWEKQWSYVLSNFQPRQLYTIGEVSETIIPFRKNIQIETAEELPGTLVLAAPMNGQFYQGTLALPSFHHPEDCCYIFGSDNVHLTEDHMGKARPDYTIYVPTDTADNMFSFMAGAVTLYDRRVKLG